MVGRPGISKACFECKRRRKGCDLRRPACSQCVRLGLKCPGYSSGLTFVYETKNSQSLQGAFASESSSGLPPIQHSSSLIKLATQNGLSDHFWHLYLPQSYLSPLSHGGALHDIFYAVQESNEHDRASKYAFRSLCCLTVARDCSDPAMFRQSSIFYGMSMRELRKAIGDAHRGSLTSYPSMTLTCNLLVLYEVGIRSHWKYNITDRSQFLEDLGRSHQGFFTHGQGLAQMVELQGPTSFRDGIAWRTFQGVRFAIVLTSMLQRRSSFLASEDWCTIPWQTRPKQAWQRVVDILVQVPGLIEEADKLPLQACHAPQHQTSGLSKACHRIDKGLHACYHELPSLLGLEPNTQLWFVKQTTLKDFPFPTEVFFADQALAQALVIFWTTIVHAYNVLQNVDSQVKLAISEPHTSLALRYLRPRNPDIIHVAMRIAQSTPYFLQPDMGLLMHKIFAYPMAVAHSYFASLDLQAASDHSGVNAADIQRYLEKTSQAMYLKTFQLRELSKLS
jgi:hypothetical protein